MFLSLPDAATSAHPAILSIAIPSFLPLWTSDLQKGRRLCSSDPHLSVPTATSNVCADEVAQVPAMASSLKAWGVLALLLCLQLSPCAQSSSRREFLDQHHLNTDKGFFLYSCDALMTEKGLKPKSLHIFVYMPWYKVEHTCISGNWKYRYKNSYVWTQTPVKVLYCYWEKFKKKYTEIRSYNYVQFHCNADGYVDSIEDMMLMEPILA